MPRFAVAHLGVARFPSPAERRRTARSAMLKATRDTHARAERLIQHVRALETSDPRAVDLLEREAYELRSRPQLPDGATDPVLEAPTLLDSVVTERWQAYAAISRVRFAVAKCRTALARERIAAGRRR